ncbi:hypothetical protein IGI04_000059 [Brassica rapa subsp. trilocularis]|uniref:Uncharacterized protein n=1 Tax=Brassica rapa subsp. trilocularis TaxID=1813537 RepID=A0ABQ7NNP1_BRACM|nr:hypothetical protein IGI04_000059 [Brassica rapa subsp. trilocularis]
MTLERPLRATYQGRSRSRATRWSDTPKSLATSRPETPKIGPGATSRSDTCKSLRSNHNASSELATQLLILRHFSPESSILDHPRSNPYAHEFSFPLVKKCFDIPQNWFDNLLYYNICFRSLENF